MKCNLLLLFLLFLVPCYSNAQVLQDLRSCPPCLLPGPGLCAVQVSDTLCVSGNAQFNNTVQINGNLNVCGKGTFGGIRAAGTRAIPCTGPNLELEVLGDEGISGNLYVCGVITAAGFSGPGSLGMGGLPGNTGAMGAPGNTGITGSTGPMGNTGAIGAQGATGVTGITGDTGAIGSTGLMGSTGDMGPQGATGAVGITGATGNTGATGPMGDTGLMGIAGIPGIMGITGNIGLTGPTGSDGAAGVLDTTVPLFLSNITPSTNCSNGALVVAGGVGVGGNVNVCGAITTMGIVNAPAFIAAGTGNCSEVGATPAGGAVQVAGGASIAQDLCMGGGILLPGAPAAGGTETPFNYYQEYSATMNSIYVVAGGGAVSFGTVPVHITRIGKRVTINVGTSTAFATTGLSGLFLIGNFPAEFIPHGNLTANPGAFCKPVDVTDNLGGLHPGFASMASNGEIFILASNLLSFPGTVTSYTIQAFSITYGVTF